MRKKLESIHFSAGIMLFSSPGLKRLLYTVPLIKSVNLLVSALSVRSLEGRRNVFESLKANFC